MYIKGLVISLTSYPVRINSIRPCLESLLKQSVKPEKIILWLSPEEFPKLERDLPQEIMRLTEQGLEIRWTGNIRSYKKLIPTLREFGDQAIVTADDDAVYPRDWLESMYNEYRSCGYAKKLYAHRVHRITFSESGQIRPYLQWFWEIRDNSCSYLNMATGVGGILYPPGCLHAEVLNHAAFTRLAPRSDDLFFWAMAVLNDTPTQVVSDIRLPADLIPNDPDALFHENINGGNNRQLEALMEHYSELKLKIVIAAKVELKHALAALAKRHPAKA